MRQFIGWVRNYCAKLLNLVNGRKTIQNGGGVENTYMEDIPRTNINFINSSDLPSTIQSLYTSCLKRINLVKIQIARKSIG